MINGLQYTDILGSLLDIAKNWWECSAEHNCLEVYQVSSFHFKKDIKGKKCDALNLNHS